MKEIKLMYPLEMYYPDYFKDFPTEEEIYHVIADYREVINDTNSTQEERKTKELSLSLLQEKIVEHDYFKGIRNILEQFFIENKNPAEIFEILYPYDEKQIEIYKAQFTDACDLLSLEEGIVDWSRMGINWYNFKKSEGLLK